jgi:hypothetical protein
MKEVTKFIKKFVDEMRIIDVKRLSYKQAKISDNELKTIKKELCSVILGKN